MDMIDIALTIMLGAAAFALISIAILCIRALSTLEKTNSLLDNANKTVDDINKKLDMLQEPVQAVTDGVMTIMSWRDKLESILSGAFLFNSIKKRKNKGKGAE